MSTHKWIERICAVATVLALVLTVLFMNGELLGIQVVAATLGYENRLFDNSRVHTIDIRMDDVDAFIAAAQSEQYVVCDVVIDGEAIRNVGIRAKGNTSLMNVTTMGSKRYSFKIEFDQYDSTKSYHGLDKLSLNNLIQDSTMMKDYLAYTLMREFDADTPLCSFAYITINGEEWGLYLAVEAVEDSFLRRNYGNQYGELYKPDGLSMGGGGDEPAAPDNADPNQGGDDSSGGGEVADPNATEPAGEGGSPGGESAGGETADPNATEATQPAGSPGGESAGGEAATIPEGEDATAPAEGESAGGESAGGEAADPNATTPAAPEDGEDSSAGEEGTATQPADPAATEPAGDASSGGGETTENPDPNQGGDDGSSGGGFGGMGSSDVKLQYAGDSVSSYSSIFGNAKTDISEQDQTRLIASLKALNEGDVSVVDVENVLRYFVVHNYVVNGDSYTGSIIHNYYLYEEDGVLNMIPWDYNLAFGTFQGNDSDATINDDIDMPLSTTGKDRPMFDWIINDAEYLQAYHELFQEFLDTVDPVAIVEEAYELIKPYVEKDPTKFCSYQDFENGVEAMLSFCKLRSESVRLQLSGSDARVNASGLSISALGVMGGDQATPDGSGSGEGEENTDPNQPAGEDSSAGEEGTQTPDPEATQPADPGVTDPSVPADSEGGEDSSAGEEGTATLPADPNATEPAAPEGSEGGESAGGEPADPNATEPTAPEGSEGGESAGGEPADPNATEPTAPEGSEGGESAGGESAGGETTDPNATEPAAPEGSEGGESTGGEPSGDQSGGFPNMGQNGFGTMQNESEWILLGISLVVLVLGLLIAVLFKR